jgi:hypothetical protein
MSLPPFPWRYPKPQAHLPSSVFSSPLPSFLLLLPTGWVARLSVSGSVIAMVGKDCVAIASDLRLGNQALLVAANFEKVSPLSSFSPYPSRPSVRKELNVS